MRKCLDILCRLLAALVATTLLLGGVSAAVGSEEVAEPAPLKVGQPAPPLVAPTLDGGTYSLGAQKGKAVLVIFWATW